MGRERFTPEQIIGKLREAELLLGQGMKIGEVIRKLGIVDQAKHFNELETEKSRL